MSILVRALASSVMTVALAASPLATSPVAAGTGAHIAVPHFVDEAAAAGVEHAYEGSWEFFVGGGVATFDCDEDGRPDLYLAGGSAPAGLFRNASPSGGALRFERLPSETADLSEVVGAYPLDIDSDGHVDLAVLRRGEDVLLRGLGDCGFERANEAWSFDGGNGWTTAFSATWEDGQAWPTLAFGTYVDHVDDQGLATCGVNHLYRPASSGSAFAAPLPLEPGRCALSMLFSDWSRSGQRDLRVSNDRHYYYADGEEQLWQMRLGEPPRLFTHQDGWRPVTIFGMGIASQDLTGDGYPEYYLTSIGSNRLETLADDPTVPTFKDIAHAKGITLTMPSIGRPIDPSTSWHPEFDDVNNDRLMDLFVSKGNVDEDPESALRDPSQLLLGLPDGTFREVAGRAGILDMVRTRGAALVDLNNDGLLDLVEVKRLENVRIFRNVGGGKAAQPRPMGHWLGVTLSQDAPNVDAIGAWIEVESGGHSVEREVTVGGGHVSGELGPLHVGLGGASEARVRVTWPDGSVGAWQTVTSDQVVDIVRGADGAGA